MLGTSDKSSVTLEKLIGQKHLRELSRYLRIRRKFWDQLGTEIRFAMDFLISQSVLDCNRVGLGDKAREILELAEFENAEFPRIEGLVLEELASEDLEEILLSRLIRIAYQLENDKRRRPYRKALLEKSLRSTLADLESLGLEGKAKKTVKRAMKSVRSKKQREALAQK